MLELFENSITTADKQAAADQEGEQLKKFNCLILIGNTYNIKARIYFWNLKKKDRVWHAKQGFDQVIKAMFKLSELSARGGSSSELLMISWENIMRESFSDPCPSCTCALSAFQTMTNDQMIARMLAPMIR